ncbi:MAG TPA: hypothetical protein VMM84_15785 [Pyrinomonadaceae bacterium]|nr:hypothetical protein [Pyrinomonadaceae bacterium]
MLRPQRLSESGRANPNCLTVPVKALAALVLLFAGIHVHAQSLEAKISVISLSPARLRIEGKSAHPTTRWSFRNTYAGILGLGERLEKLELLNSEGATVAVKKLAAGEFRSSEETKRFRYEVMLGEPLPARMTHVSWINQTEGFLMLADLLPLQNASSALLSLELPNRWRAASAFQPDETGRYQLTDPDKAVFVIGETLRELRRKANSTQLIFLGVGDWPFNASDVLGVAVKLVKECLVLTGSDLSEPAVIMLAPLPGGVGPESWRAETRGNTVVLLVGRQANRNALLARLSVILSHELLHLWVPNALKLEGDYDWFFEGFTVYQALRIATRVGIIRFNDYLDTIGRVYDSYLSAPDRDRFSLLEASERRWTANSSLVYDKGMLVALLYDLTIRTDSNNRRSLDNLYQEIFRIARSSGPTDANAALLSGLAKEVEMKEAMQDLIVGPGRIHLDVALRPFGLEVISQGSRSRVQVAADLTSSQRNLLRSLGYKG